MTEKPMTASRSAEQPRNAVPEGGGAQGRPTHWPGSPGVLSLVISVGVYVVSCGFLHPGYAILDDLKMISIAVGYPGVQPAPFLIFSNVLLGLMLRPLYAMGTALNWEVILFSIINLLSLWVLLYILFSAAASTTYKILGAALVLACGSYYVFNITFTSTAALACFAGLSGVVAGALASAGKRTALLLGGTALIFAGSLVRIQMLYLVAALMIASIAFLYRRVQLKTLGLASALAAAMVFAGFAFDRLYVRAYPAWNTYYFYNQIAQMVQDSHRLENMHVEIRRIGWSGNDQELFARSFFADAGIYSVDHLRYLVDHVSGIGQDPLYSAQSLASRLTTVSAAPFLLVCITAWLWTLAFGAPISTKIAIPCLTLVSIGESFGLTWIYKDPEYVLLASLANSAILCILIPAWTTEDGLHSPRSRPRGRLAIALSGACVLTAIGAMTMSARQAILTSNDSFAKQRAYAGILMDLGRLQSDGKLPKDAVIISPAYGIPVDWSNPFLLDFPKIPYLDTGWSTFSPSYEQALHNFGIASLPEALLEKSNVYLMSETIFKNFLARYYQEHEGTAVSCETVYTLGYPDRYAGYHEVELYKVVKTP